MCCCWSSVCWGAARGSQVKSEAFCRRLWAPWVWPTPRTVLLGSRRPSWGSWPAGRCGPRAAGSESVPPRTSATRYASAPGQGVAGGTGVTLPDQVCISTCRFEPPLRSLVAFAVAMHTRNRNGPVQGLRSPDWTLAPSVDRA